MTTIDYMFHLKLLLTCLVTAALTGYLLRRETFGPVREKPDKVNADDIANTICILAFFLACLAGFYALMILIWKIDLWLLP